MNADTLNLAGLFCGFLSAVLLFFFGVPPPVNPTGASFIVTSTVNQADIDKAKRYKAISHFALVLLMTSFALQLVAVLVQ
jgi:hypothetical protein